MIRINHDARNKLLTLEDLSEAELDQVKAAFSKLAGVIGADLGGVHEDATDVRKGVKQAESAIVRKWKADP